MTKRLFIFAGYDPDGIVDESLTFYLRALSGLGDIVFNMDNDASEYELSKVNAIPNVLYAAADRHGEYDFGSYKRGYIWARDKDILKNYDWVYLVNDSVFGPLRDLNPILTDLESRGADAVGMLWVSGTNYWPNHLQSWFVGIRNKFINAEWLNQFMISVKKLRNKASITEKYEFGLTKLFIDNELIISAFRGEKDGMIVYRKSGHLVRQGFPFIKKSIFLGVPEDNPDIRFFARMAFKNVPNIYLQNVIKDNLCRLNERKFKRVLNGMVPYILSRLQKVIIHIRHGMRIIVFGIPIIGVKERNKKTIITLLGLIPIAKFHPEYYIGIRTRWQEFKTRARHNFITFLHGKSTRKKTHILLSLSQFSKNVSLGGAKLHLGCGTVYKEGWINIDNNSDKNCKKLDLRWNLGNGIPARNDTIDFIYHEHILEHLTPQQSQMFLGECNRVLKPGGVMRFSIPDLAAVVDEYINPKTFAANQWIREKYGYADASPATAINIHFRNWGHQWLYDWDEVIHRLGEIGIDESQVKKCEFGKSDYPELTNVDTRDDEKCIIIEVIK